MEIFEDSGERVALVPKLLLSKCHYICVHCHTLYCLERATIEISRDPIRSIFLSHTCAVHLEAGLKHCDAGFTVYACVCVCVCVHVYITMSMPSPYSYIYIYLSVPFAQKPQLAKPRHVGWRPPVNCWTAAVATR